jgi:DNA-directed RNA polymerase specialized sigma24 family protein
VAGSAPGQPGRDRRRGFAGLPDGPGGRANAAPTAPPTALPAGPGAVGQRPPVADPGETLSSLLRRACAEDRAAWQELVRRFGWLLLRTARGVGLNDSDAADVAQLTWMRLWEHGHKIRNPECLPAWLTATARREGLRVAMSGKSQVLCADPAAEHGDRSRVAVTDIYPVDGDYEPLMEQALSRLPTRYERLIRLLMSDSCPSYTEVARTLDLPIGSIGPMRMRALDMLRRTPELAGAWLTGRNGRLRRPAEVVYPPAPTGAPGASHWPAAM